MALMKSQVVKLYKTAHIGGKEYFFRMRYSIITLLLLSVFVYGWTGLIKIYCRVGKGNNNKQLLIKKRSLTAVRNQELLFMGRDYPLGYEYFQAKCHGAFLKNSNETDPEKIAALIKHGEYIIKELEALYMLRKYRTLKRRYYDDNEWNARYQMSLKNIESSV